MVVENIILLSSPVNCIFVSIGIATLVFALVKYLVNKGRFSQNDVIGTSNQAAGFLYSKLINTILTILTIGYF